MNGSRRTFMWASLGLVLTGCAQSRQISSIPSTPWPEPTVPPSPDHRATTAPHTAASGTPTGDDDGILPRYSWAEAREVPYRLNPMGQIQRITIHHEGNPYPVTFTDIASTRNELEKIRSYHVDQRGWGDIGYHYVIDRAGRVWQGRSLSYQGAHVRDHNENNIGVMVLGNFDRQMPSSAQLNTLQRFVRELRRKYSVPVSGSARRSMVRTHQEWVPTACPGRHLQPRVETLRSNGALI